MSFHHLSTSEVLEKTNSSENGLSTVEVKKRLVEFGPNQLEEIQKIHFWKILLEQFSSFLVLLLFGAAILSFVIGEPFDAGVILVVLVLNGAVGFFQEYKAEQALAKLKHLETFKALVLRDGEEKEIEASQLVPGDVVFLTEGNRVPADGRIIQTVNLQIDESMLTGESKSVTKDSKKVVEKINLAEQVSMAFSGTVVTKGKGRMVVTATGMETQIGNIAQLVQSATTGSTPLQLTLDKLGKTLGLVSVGVALPALVFGLRSGRDPVEIALTTIALAVSAIPEGLPIVVTVVLAFGVKRMVKKQVLIRKLNAVEALGSTDIICTDKTGTITQNKMEVQSVFVPGLGVKVLKGNISLLRREALDLAKIALLNNDATLSVGDPTEKALVSFALDLGLKMSFRKQHKRINEAPFSSETKYMVTFNQVGGKTQAFAKGAPEKILQLCKIGADDKRVALEKIEEFSKQGMRVLAFATKSVGGEKDFEHHEGYKFLGLVGLMDPPRKSVKVAIARCFEAGIRVIMITGDHPITAESIASEVGIESEMVVTGHEIDFFNEAKLAQVVKTINIFARVSPKHKIMILKALQSQKHFVAMTGDGVNDAPALKEANIGIAVGSGSDLAKEVADMVILDDDFSSIVAAINEGRGIFSNIKKVIIFIIAVNFDEVLLVMSSLFFGLPLPFLPIHLLWINLATDTFPSLALALDPYAKNLMRHHPYDPRQEIMKGVLRFSALAAAVAFVSGFGVFLIDLFVLKSSVIHAQTMVFTVTVLFELFFIFIVRTNKRLKDSKPFENKWLWGAVGLALFLQLFAIYMPFAGRVFKTVPLEVADWLMLIPFAMLGIIVFELLRMSNHFFFKEHIEHDSGRRLVKAKVSLAKNVVKSRDKAEAK